MKMKKRLFSLMLIAALLVTLLLPASTEDAAVSDYTITDPYATVDWDSWKQYKTNLHAHTLYSDGEMSITDVVEEYYRQGYEILAVTDHGVINTGWNQPHKMIPLIGYNAFLHRKETVPMSDERYEQIINGTDRGGVGMMDVKLGVEMNALTMRKNHVNGFFCGWGQGYLGKEEDYETSIARTQEAGGISVINHPGDFFHANHDPERARDWNNLKVFTDALMKYPSCVGVEALNRIDTADRCDRIVWDHLLMYCIPRGRNVWAFSNDDSHVLSDIGLTAEMMLMPEKSEAALRTAMENGTFFACAKIARNEMGEDFVGDGNYAKITRITVDEANDVIRVEAENADTIEWIADEKVIAVGPQIDLREHADQIGAYVRFQVKNAGGLVLSQAFVCDDGDMQRHLIPEVQAPERSWIETIFYRIMEALRKNLLGELFYRILVLDR